MNFKQIIFDFDMTLVDTSKGSAFCYEKAILAAGGDFSRFDLPKYMGEFLDATYLRIKNPLIEYAEFERVFYYYSHKKMAEMSVLYNDTVNLLTELSKTRCLSIVTNKDRKCVEQILRFHNIKKELFRIILCCDDVKQRKPHPEGLINCIKELSCNKNECVYVGDSLTDVEFANNAGIKCYRVNRNENEPLNSNEIRTLTELLWMI